MKTVKLPLASAVARVASGAAICFMATGIQAQILEEVTVTAQKREQNLQDVGISVTAFDGNQLNSLGMTNSVDITQQVPAMQLQTFTPAFTIINLRGISQNNFQDNLEAPVAVYVDGAYVPSMNAINGQLFDVGRVEVLRGPQGTLFGRNTTGGLVHYLTNGAVDTDLNGYLKATVGEFDQRAFEGAIGGGTETVRGRLAGRWEEYDGYTESVVPGIRDAHGADGYTIRGSMQVDVTDDFLVDLRVTKSKDDDVPSGTYSINFAGFDPETGLGTNVPGRLTDELEHASSVEGSYSRDTTNVTATLTWNVSPDMELVSITNYMDLDKDYLEDAGGGLFFFPYENNSDFETFSQEIRLSGGSDRMRWQTGLYYLDMTTDNSQNVRGATILEGSGATTDSAVQFTNTSLDSRNVSVFGQVEYDFASSWTLIAGLRWSDDQKDLSFLQSYAEPEAGIPLMQVFDIAAVPIDGLDEIEYDDVAARLQLNYVTENDTLVYGSISRGIKGGNWSIDPLGTVAAIDPGNLKHGEETLLSYEFGVKAEFGTVARINAAVYYYDYEDYQAFSILGLTPQVTNSDASSQGGELELTLYPMDGLDILLGAAYIDSTVDAVPDVFGGTVETEFPNAPALSLNALIRYEWDVMGGRMAAQVDGVWNDDQYIEATNSQISFEDEYMVWNARLSYTSANDNWEVAGWVKNAGDEVYRLYNLDLGLLGISEEVYAPPRWYGATVTYSF
ncbi:TonB-dependent receptor [Kineobactrum sediminis]|uniref:TonB-dependent receptor n=1 Tax=Kineobactrum sediminis TaxID=1905677 RepID=A0A2N5Y209_9GAMM|nr:TonB-dependent receptor [Kineobactrum sediminis]PLW82421.1 TonB-dependent receptor [Kineobactrum sediminis]